MILQKYKICVNYKYSLWIQFTPILTKDDMDAVSHSCTHMQNSSSKSCRKDPSNRNLFEIVVPKSIAEKNTAKKTQVQKFNTWISIQKLCALIRKTRIYTAEYLCMCYYKPCNTVSCDIVK